MDIYATGGPSDIKTITAEQLDGLMAEAERKDYNAVGPPRWLAANKHRIRQVLVVAFGPEGERAYRCYVVAVFEEDSEEPGGRFTLDVDRATFHSLSDFPYELVVESAHRYLMTIPPAPFDPDQVNQAL